MRAYQTNPAGQSKNAFTVINNVRDHCQQPADKKFLLLTLATYCDGKGICWPSNRSLIRATGTSERTIQRMLKKLEADGELKVLASGAGRDQKRIIQLHRYVVTPFSSTVINAKPVTAMTPLNSTPILGEVSRNNHSEQPNTLTESTHPLLRKEVRFPFFEGEEFLSEEERNAVHYFNKKLRRRGWQSVRKLSPAVEQVLEIFEPERIIELVDYVLQNPDAPDLPARRTLVRLCWSSY
jgi:hypothetical protein